MAEAAGQPDMAHQVAANLAAVRTAIAAAADKAGRDAGGIRLIAVSKLQPLERVEAALVAGQRIFGENYVQPSASRWPDLRQRFDDVELHMIGPLQTNKARDAVRLFDVVQTVDRPKLARALAREIERQDRRPRFFIQVNTGEEPQKAGIWPEEVDAFVALCRDELKLDIAGLMAIPPVDEEPSPHFALLGQIARRNDLSGLSMGMSSDFETAVAFGATHVRVGTAIFGARPPR